MRKVIADELLRSKLHDLLEAVQICDADGKIIGWYNPSPETQKELYKNLKLPAHLTPEELDRRASVAGGKPLAQIWKELGRA